MALIPQYPIVTPRLWLRPFTRGDVDGVHAYRGQSTVAEHLFDAALSREECALVLQQRIGQIQWQQEGDKIVMAVDDAQGNLVGEVSMIWRSADARQAELGWIFHPDHQGRGYATEAARALLTLAFELGDIHRVYARCGVENAPSWRLMERLGMRREAHFREHSFFKGRWDEEYIYAILRRDWPNQIAEGQSE